MRHLGDITKINWFEVEPVDCVTGGSPCQDLSVAGKRAGLAGERSGLYMEQIRCIKELRWRDIQSGRTGAMVRPRWMVWENVPGAFSSNGGKDFAAVLEEAVKIVEPQAPPIPVPDKGWPSAGCLSDVDGRWSIAWRVHDAQFWGVPQRRRRIALVCDFGGMSAPEVLFERKGLRGDTAESGTAREGIAGDAEAGFNSAVRDVNTYCLQGNGIDRADAAGCNGKGWREDACYTLHTIDRPAVRAEVRCLTPWEAQSARVYDQDGVWHSLNANENGGMARDSVMCYGSKPAVVAPARVLDMTHACDVIRECGDVAPSLQARMGTGGNQVPLTYGIGNGQAHEAVTMAQEVSQTLNTMHDKQAILYQPKSAMEENWAESKIKNAIRAGESKVSHAVMCEDVSHTLRAKANCAYREDTETYPVQNMMVRRLTPLECERLQGYPDGWTDIGEWIDSKGKKHKEADSPRYKALGNSIALPFWFWLLRRISARYERPATLGSLFDGIGGFPLCWERCNGKGTALWASEIEEFPMAVTKKRFGEDKMKTMKKKKLPTYTVLIRTPSGTEIMTKTNDFTKARRAYARYKGMCRLCIDGRELRILEADRLMDDGSHGVLEQIFIPRRAKEKEDIHKLRPAR